MDNEIIIIIKEISAYLGLILTLFSIIKFFKENGVGRTIGTIIAIAFTVIFLKYLILFAAEDIGYIYIVTLFINIVYLAVVLRFLVDQYQNECFHMSHKEYIEFVFKLEHDRICMALLFSPIVGLIINQIFKQPSNTQLYNFIMELKTLKINFSLYAYLWDNLLFALYFLIKILEVLFTIYCCYKGSMGICKTGYSSAKLFFICIAVLCVFVFISSNFYYNGLIKLFAEFG